MTERTYEAFGEIPITYSKDKRTRDIKAFRDAVKESGKVALMDVLHFLMDNGVLFDVILSITSMLAVVAALLSNIDASRRYRESIEPKLLMSLYRNESGLLCLCIKNVGGCAAKYIKFRVLNPLSHRVEAALAFGEICPQEEKLIKLDMFGNNVDFMCVKVEFRANKKTIKYCRNVEMNSLKLDLIKIKGIEELNNNLKRIAEYLDGVDTIGASKQIYLKSQRELLEYICYAVNNAAHDVINHNEDSYRNAMSKITREIINIDIAAETDKTDKTDKTDEHTIHMMIPFE